MPAVRVGPGCREKQVNSRRDQWQLGLDSRPLIGKAARHSRYTAAGLEKKAFILPILPLGDSDAKRARHCSHCRYQGTCSGRPLLEFQDVAPPGPCSVEARLCELAERRGVCLPQANPFDRIVVHSPNPKRYRGRAACIAANQGS